MGWWNVSRVARAMGDSLRLGTGLDRKLPCIGDGPVQLLTGVIESVCEAYSRGLGRPPTVEELDFLWAHCTRPLRPARMERCPESEIL